MPINSQELLAQIEKDAPGLRASQSELEKYIAEALQVYQSADSEIWRNATASNHSGRALAYPLEEAGQSNFISLPPDNYVVVASDGSVIPPDRHGGSPNYHVINIGRVMLGYGDAPTSDISPRTLFFSGGVTDEENEASNSVVLDLKRDVLEIEAAFELATSHKADLALLDGALTMWNSRTMTDQQSNSYREKYYATLQRFEDEQIPVAGYISNTHSQGVTNSLRLLASLQPPQLNLFGDKVPLQLAPSRPKAGRGKPDGLKGVRDAHIFSRVLAVGEYSEVFQTTFEEPKELADYIAKVCFIYWRTPQEVVRVEVPEWVAAQGLLPYVMSLVAVQHQRGQGYPAALIEAHECAVLKQTDRDILRIFLEQRGLLSSESQKGRSKRLRPV